MSCESALRRAATRSHRGGTGVPTLAFVGCLNREAPYFQGARGKGIAVFAFDEASGRLAPLAEKDGVDNPTYLSIHPANGCLYANSEVFGWAEGVVTAYRIDPDSGTLTYLDKQPTRGGITAHNSVDRSGRHLLVANYALGREGPDQSVIVLPIHTDGSLGAPVCSRAHEGTGPGGRAPGAPACPLHPGEPRQPVRRSERPGDRQAGVLPLRRHRRRACAGAERRSPACRQDAGRATSSSIPPARSPTRSTSSIRRSRRCASIRSTAPSACCRPCRRCRRATMAKAIAPTCR